MSKKMKKTPPMRRKFTVLMQKKLLGLFIFVVAVFVFLVGYAACINLSKGKEYKRRVLDQQQYSGRVIPFKRGDILDANGTKLATSERVYNVILDPKALLGDEEQEDEERRAERIKAVKAVLKKYLEIEPEDVQKALDEKPESRYVILKKKIDYKTAKAYKKAAADDPDVQGVWLEEDYLRTYPYGTLASTLIGFTVDGNLGNSGLEAEYNQELNGRDGRKYGYLDADAGAEQTVKEAVNGHTITTTIDVNLQSIVERHVKAFNDELKNGAEQGEGSKNTAVLVMDPNTGAILAEAVYPDYDLNNPRDLTKYYTEEELNGMSAEDKLRISNSLWNNFCVNATYEPGSTIKPFTVAAALETGHLHGDETFYCPGSLQVGDTNIKCISFSKGGHGTQTLSQAIENSCNVALMEIGLSMGKEEFTRYQNIFNFGKYTGVDIPGEASGLLYNLDSMGDVDLATNTFGQNFNVTMVQLASGFCSLINGGNYYKPHVVKSIQDAGGNVIETIDPVLEKKTVSEETSAMLKSYLYNVVEFGSGQNAKVEGYAVGGKTGTAEKLPRSENKNLVSFIGYAPQENPEIVVYVVVDEPNVPDQAATSGRVSRLAADIMAEAFPYLGITHN